MEARDIATSMAPFRPYRHRVDIVVEGKILNWPILVSDIDAQSRSDEIKAELEERRDVDPQARAQASNFEEWCLDLMGPILYERYIKPYTENSGDVWRGHCRLSGRHAGFQCVGITTHTCSWILFRGGQLDPAATPT